MPCHVIREERRRAADVLAMLRRGECWCSQWWPPLGIGKHDAPCDAARAYVAEAEEGGK